jgi:hypothetical protein
MEIQPETICPSCKSAVSAAAYFCPNCGKQLRDKPPDTTLLKKIIVYSVSLFLPPFGLWYAWKYLKYGDYESRRICIIAVILTIISIIVTTWLTAGFINSIFQSLNEINNLSI